MPYLFQDFNLSSYPINIHLVLYLPFLKDLDRNLLLGDALNAQLYFTESTLTQCLDKQKVRNLLNLLVFAFVLNISLDELF